MRKRKNPIAYKYNEGNLRRWAYLHLLKAESLKQAVREATDYFFKFYNFRDYPFVRMSDISTMIEKILSYWLEKWNSVPKISKLTKNNEWRDFIFSVELPSDIISENIIKQWIYKNLRNLSPRIAAQNFMRTFNYSLFWENDTFLCLVNLFQNIQNKWRAGSTPAFLYDDKSWKVFIDTLNLEFYGDMYYPQFLKQWEIANKKLL